MSDIVARLRKRREAELIGGYERIEWEDKDAIEAADKIDDLRDEVARLAAENEKLQAATQWQPIDVEPSHAMRVLLFYPESYAPLFDGATYAVEAAYFIHGQWLEIGTNHSAFEWEKPTHWMPLPPPPEDKSDE